MMSAWTPRFAFKEVAKMLVGSRNVVLMLYAQPETMWPLVNVCLGILGTIQT